MPEKNNNNNNSSNSNSLGICKRLFNFFMNSLVARGLKRVTLGQQPLRQGYVRYKDHENSKHDPGSEIEILFKESEELGPWTPVDPVVSKTMQPPAGGKKEPSTVQERIESQLQGKVEPNFTTVAQAGTVPKKTATINGNEKEDRSKMESQGIPIENSTPKRFSVATNINERSDEFIRSKREAMRRNTGMEPKKKD